MSKHNNKNLWDKSNKKECEEVVELRKEIVNRFTEMLRIRALCDGVCTDVVYDTRKQRLDIYSHYDVVAVHSHVGANFLVSSSFSIECFVYNAYEEIKKSLIDSFDEIENKQKREAEVDEHWEFIELGGM